MHANPAEVLQELRRRIDGGAKLRLELLSKDEMAAMSTLIYEGVAEIVEEACRPFLIRVLNS